MTSRSTASLLAALFFVAAPGGARAGETARTVAVADFSVRAPGGRAAQAAWLGPAVAELLQAKMQLFRGARVLERTRLALPRQEDAAGDGPGEPPDGLLRITPAAVLVFGAVEIAPGDGEPVRIKVQARAVETETAAVLANAAFSGTAELAGLLQVAESLAKGLAEALGFTYTPDQLAYAEPMALDALKVYLEGEAHAAAGKQREAIEAYQRALEGNGGKYYPAAHRAQGEAYRALAASLGTEEARRTREEYLEKFQADALVASEALFDLGLAYEANGLWREAVGAYDDYLSAVGNEGETVRWSFAASRDAGISNASIPFPAVADRGRLHLVVQGVKATQGFWWMTLDAATGAVLGSVPLLPALGVPPEEATELRLFVADRDRVYLYWYRVKGRDANGVIVGNSYFGDPWVGALDPAGRLLWKVPIGAPDRHIVDARAIDGQLCVVIGAGIGPREWLLLDAASGRTLERFGPGEGAFDAAGVRYLPPYFDAKAAREGGGWTPGVRYPTGRPGVTFSTTVGSGLSKGEWSTRGVSFFEGDRQVASLPRMLPVFKDPPLEGDDLPLVVFDGGWRYRQVLPKDWSVSKDFFNDPPEEKPTGVPGVTVFGWGAYTGLFEDGKQVLRLPRAELLGDAFTAPTRGWIVLRGKDGVTAVNPDGWRTAELYGGTQLEPTLHAQDAEYFLFSMRNDPSRGGIDPRYGAVTTEAGRVLHLVAKASGTVVAKHFLKGFRHLMLVDHDPVIVADETLSRIRLVHQRQTVVRPAAEAHLRKAVCLTEAGDDAAAAESLARFEADFAGDPRSPLQRMRGAARRGDRTEAARMGLRAMASGGLAEAELRECLDAVRAVRPEVRDAVAAKVRSRLLLRSLAAPGVLVATPEGRGQNAVHVVVDTVRRTSSVVPTPEFSRAWSLKMRYEGRRVLGLHDVEGSSIDHVTDELVGRGGGEIDSRHEVSGIDLLTGVRTRGAKFPFSDGVWLPGRRPSIGGRLGRQETVFLLDPDRLTETDRLDVRGHEVPPLFAGEVLVLGGGAADRRVWRAESREASFLVLDSVAGLILGTKRVTLEEETVAAVTADRDRLVVGLNSYPPGRVRLESFALGPQGRTWTWRAEGRLAGNIVFEGDRLAFPLVEADPAPPGPASGGESRIRRASLDFETGKELLAAPLAPNSWAPGTIRPETRVRIFPGLATWRAERDSFNPGRDVYRAFTPDRLPLRVDEGGDGHGCLVVMDDEASAFLQDFRFEAMPDHVIPAIVCADTVYESVGGGVVLIKDFVGGVGLERVIRDGKIGLWR